MSDKLLPCPFCGGVEVSSYVNEDEHVWEVICRECFASVGSSAGRKHAETRWNTRSHNKNDEWTPVAHNFTLKGSHALQWDDANQLLWIDCCHESHLAFVTLGDNLCFFERKEMP